MEDPPAEPRIIEVVASPANPASVGPGGGATGGSGAISATGNKKQDSELQPLKSGNMADLDEPTDGACQETTRVLGKKTIIISPNFFRRQRKHSGSSRDRRTRGEQGERRGWEGRRARGQCYRANASYRSAELLGVV